MRDRPPIYSHLDLRHRARIALIVVERPDILIMEGLNVLQPRARSTTRWPSLAVSDFFDFSVFVDAEESLHQAWYLERFMRLRKTAFQDERSYFRDGRRHVPSRTRIHWGLQASGTPSTARTCVENIEPTRERATAILRKGADHVISSGSARSSPRSQGDRRR
jgi:type I pantothenate kinase